MQQANPNRVFSLLLYILGFLLFWEWLRPLSVLVKGTDVSYFVSFAAFSFFLSYLKLPYWVSFPAKLLGVAYALHILFFYNTSFFDVIWLHYFYNDFMKNMSFMINGNWVGMTQLFRSFLFFVLLWIVSYLMNYWLIQARKLFLFFFVTVVYLTVLDSFTMYHADGAIVRTMIIGLVLIGLLRLLKIQEKEQVSFQKGGFPLPWFFGLIGLIAIALVVGLAAPKANAKWPDPVPFIQKAANGYGGSVLTNGLGEQRIGYDANDSHLGGPFQMDNTLVFTAQSRYAHYWKIATKNTYTGKGWIVQPNPKVQTISNLSTLSSNPILSAYGPEASKEKLTDVVKMNLSSFPQLAYGGDPLSISGGQVDQLLLNPSSGKLEPEFHGRTVTPKTYQLTYNYPTFSVPLLQKVTGNGNDPASIKQTYLQLPSELPRRVKALAEKITSGKPNRYDKAQAIVTYLNGPQFSYDTQNVLKPGPNQDYVDQFLFDSKRGYCDNFSSSMVVMLRSIGIPARWVKGFSQGSYEKSVNLSTVQYQIKESDAHSWVEVYFPGAGWVPFEPTKGFSNLFQFDYGKPAAAQSSTTPAKSDTSSTPQPAPNQLKRSKPITSQGPLNLGADAGAILSNVVSKHLFWWVLAFFIFLVLVGLTLFKTRRRWLPVIWKARLENRKDDVTFDLAFEKLMKLLSISGFKIKDSQTLREYAEEVDRSMGTFEMRELVQHMEKRHYSKNRSNEWSELKELWENMINRLRA